MAITRSRIGRWFEAQASNLKKWQWPGANQMRCPACSEIINILGQNDVMDCPQCHMTVPTGLEDQLRGRLEVWKENLNLPRIAVARAIAYAAGIYRFSTHGKKIQTENIEKQIEDSFGRGTAATKTSQLTTLNRSYLGHTDKGTGVAIFEVSGKTRQGRDWSQSYVVFRGSRGDARVDENAKGAGWADYNDVVGDEAVMHNIDWTANFKNYRQDVPDWAPNVKIHSGFLELYNSVKDRISAELERLGRRHVIVAGHSLGGALATVCTHHLQRSGYTPFCFAFNSPRPGNLAFVEDFNLRIATQQAEISGEGTFYRSFLFHRWSDAVSTLGTHGFDSAMDQGVADSGKTWWQGMRAQAKIDSATVIYYHPMNRWKLENLGPIDSHQYTLVERALLGAQFSR